MTTTLRSEDLIRMSSAEANVAIRELVSAARRPNPEYDAEIRARIREFEIRYEVTSERMLRELRDGTRQETAEIAEWLFWLAVQDGCGEGEA